MSVSKKHPRLSTCALAVLSVSLMAGGPLVRKAHAATSQAAPRTARVLHLKDFFGIYPNEVLEVTGTDKASIAGISYSPAIELERGIARLSYNTHRYPGYSSLSLFVGLTDSSDAGSQDTLQISADHHVLKTITAQPGAAAVKVVIPFGKIKVLRFAVRGHDPASSGLLLARPTLLTKHAPAKAPASLTLKDFFNVYPNEVEDVSGTEKATVAGISYPRAIELDRGIAGLSYNTHRHPGYTALSFLVGMTDSSDAGSQNTLVVSADGKELRSVTADPGSPAVQITVPFGRISVLRFAVRGNDPASSGLLILNPTLITK